jgi:uncharacterized protein YdiU (UPF0061 family)
MMKNKLGLAGHGHQDESLISQLEETLQLTETDMTIFFRLLPKMGRETDSEGKFLGPILQAFYAPEELRGEVLEKWIAWFEAYNARLKIELVSEEDRIERMSKSNPKFVLRNYMAQMAIDSAEGGSYDLINDLYELLKNPYEEQEDSEKWFAKRPEWARHKVGCSMLSCSS